MRARRVLSLGALALALTAPAALATPFGKPHTLGSTPLAYEYDSLFSADGPHGGVAIYAPGEKQISVKATQRLFLARVEGNGRAHRLTSTVAHAPGRSYDGGPPYLDLAVGPHWRMLTTEYRKGRVYGIREVYAVHLSPSGRRAGEQHLGTDYDVSPFFGTNARGDAIAPTGDDGAMIARAAGRFVRAPKALRVGEYLPHLAADGSLWDWRPTPDQGRATAHSGGRSWGREQSIFAGPGVDRHEFASSPAGDTLLAYGVGDLDHATIFARWSRRGRAFGQPIQLTPAYGAVPSSVIPEAIPGGAFALRWRGTDGVHHLLRARRRGSPFREALSWTPPKAADFATLLPLRGGRTVALWEIHDPDLVKPDKLRAAMISTRGRMGRTQTIAVSRRGPDFAGIELRRLGNGKRAALVYTQVRGRKKQIRLALTRR